MPIILAATVDPPQYPPSTMELMILWTPVASAKETSCPHSANVLLNLAHYTTRLGVIAQPCMPPLTGERQSQSLPKSLPLQSQSASLENMTASSNEQTPMKGYMGL